LRVLVIEDDDFSLEAMRELLESWGCIVWGASTVAQARVLVQKDIHSVDVIVSDYRLGHGDDGISAIASLRALCQRNIPACLVSGTTDGALMQAAKEAELTLLHKPVRPAKLRSLLRNLAQLASD
jgi:CheY-like chemotaxis protein